MGGGANRTHGTRGATLTEAKAIALLEQRLGSLPAGGRIRVGIGDDAAVLRPSGANLIWTVDASIEGVHFDFGWLTPADVGWRSYHAAMSDIAAMGARPLAALSSVVLPEGTSRAALAAFARGQADAAKSCGCPVIGGNVARGPGWQVTTTVLGESRRPLLRNAARPGDELWLTGGVGLAAAGLQLLRQRSGSAPVRWSAGERTCVQAWRRPQALLEEGRQLVGRARAAMDISDGLKADLPKFAAASGVRLVVDQDLLEAALPEMLRAAAARLRQSHLELALLGGEDYALVASGPRRKRPRWVRVIGSVRDGQGAVLEQRGRVLSLLAGGFDHFQRRG